MTTAPATQDPSFDVCTWARGYTPYLPEVQDDPNPYLDRIRSECPVAHSDALGGFWIVARYDDVHFVLQRHDLFSTTEGVGFDAHTFTTLGPDIPLQFDPPEHGKYRTILNPLLSPAVVQAMEPRVRELAVRLIDPIVARGRCDFIADFATPFPSEIFVGLMGLPQEDRETFLAWKDAILRAQPHEMKSVFETVKVELERYFVDVFNTRRAMADPGDDMIGKMLKARYAGERLLTLNEFVGMACLVWGAGLDTVTAQLSLAIFNLATDTSLRDRLVKDPELIPSAIEELIRFDGIVNQCRVATQDVELSGVLIRKGDRVNVMTGASGRDPQQFAEPESLDFTRQANRHFGFGAGAHRCVGSHLARLELRVAMEEIHRRIPKYRIDDTQPPMRHFGLVRGVDRLHLLVD